MRHKQDASNMVMPDKQSETGRISPKSFLKTAIFTNEIEISSDYISVKCRNTDHNPTEKCENTVAHIETYLNSTIL